MGLTLHQEFHGLELRCACLERDRDTLAIENERLRAEVTRLRGVLSWYADRANYGAPYTGTGCQVLSDLGDMARDALGRP